MRRWVAGWMCGLVFAGTCASQTPRWGVRPDGRPVQQMAAPGTRVLVLFFVATDCPVSNKTFPAMQTLRERFAAKGVRVWYVYPNTGETAAGVAGHQGVFDAGGEAVLDPDGALVRLAHAVATPEAAVLAPQRDGWHPVYAGRIDDRYVRLGLERPAATQNFAEDAVEAVLAGRLPKPATGRPVGCAIMNPGVR